MENQKKVRPWDLLIEKNKLKNISDIEKRFDICLSCEHLIKITNTCKKCGCFMVAKTKLKHATCPVGKW